MNIYFYTPELSSGGVKVIYRHVDILTTKGFHAFVVHVKKGYRVNSFKNTTPIIYWRDISLQKDDILVIPEYLAIFSNAKANLHPVIKVLKKNFSKQALKYFAFDIFNTVNRKVIYNQNAYLTFFKYPILPNHFTHPYTKKDCIATVCVSEDNYEYLKFAFPTQRIFRTRNSISPELFFPTKKKKQIAYLTFKNRSEIAQVINLLSVRNKLNGFDLVPVQGTETEIAEKFNESMIMLNFANAEGFSLPPAEAMLSGCIVIGYHGHGGKEFMLPENCFPIEQGDIVSFVKKVEEVVDCLSKNEMHFHGLISNARNFILKEYSREEEKESVLKAWEEIINFN